jgi:hypothetical protein
MMRDANHDPCSPECRLSCDTWLMSILTRAIKEYMKKVLGIEVPQLGYIPCVRLCCAAHFLGSFHQRSRVAHFLQNHGFVGSPS